MAKFHNGQGQLCTYWISLMMHNIDSECLSANKTVECIVK